MIVVLSPGTISKPLYVLIFRADILFGLPGSVLKVEIFGEIVAVTIVRLAARITMS